MGLQYVGVMRMTINFSHMPDTYFGQQKLVPMEKAAIVLSIMGERFNIPAGQTHTIDQCDSTPIEFKEPSDAEWFFEHFWIGSPVTIVGPMLIKQQDRTDIWAKVRKLDPNEYLLVVNFRSVVLEDRGFYIVVNKEKALELKLSV